MLGGQIDACLRSYAWLATGMKVQISGDKVLTPGGMVLDRVCFIQDYAVEFHLHELANVVVHLLCPVLIVQFHTGDTLEDFVRRMGLCDFVVRCNTRGKI